MTATLIVCAVLAVVGYRLSLWRNPFRACHMCSEKGKRRGYCGFCGGSGWKRRAGTRVLERKK